MIVLILNYMMKQKKHFDDDDIETFNCSGGGRCFDEKLLSSFDKVIDHSLIDLIRQYEKD